MSWDARPGRKAGLGAFLILSLGVVVSCTSISIAAPATTVPTSPPAPVATATLAPTPRPTPVASATAAPTQVPLPSPSISPSSASAASAGPRGPHEAGPANTPKDQGDPQEPDRRQGHRRSLNRGSVCRTARSGPLPMAAPSSARGARSRRRRCSPSRASPRPSSPRSSWRWPRRASSRSTSPSGRTSLWHPAGARFPSGSCSVIRAGSTTTSRTASTLDSPRNETTAGHTKISST